MSKVWSFMLIFSVVVALATGNVASVLDSVMSSGKSAVENVLQLVGMMCFWSGIFNIFEKTSAIKKFSKVFSVFVSKLFKKEEVNEKASEYISMNICSNVIGIGNAATLNGIRSMEEMQKINKKKDTPNNSMATFILINTASIQLIPTNMIAMRSMYGSTNASSIIVPIWIVTAIALVIGVISIKILNRKLV